MTSPPLPPVLPPALPPVFAAVLAGQLRRDPARPLVTFYDDATGERVELSVTTYSNWVAKTAGLVQDELDVGHGDLVLVDLPTHWLGPVWLGAAWTLGLRVTDDRGRLDEADLVVCGPDALADLADVADRVPVVALSLRPMGVRFDTALPPGVVDYGAVVLGQPDVLVPHEPGVADDVAWVDGHGDRSQRELLTTAAGDDMVAHGGRLLTDVNPCSGAGLVTLLAPLAHGGGTVWVRHPDDARWAGRYDAERVSAQLRG